MKIGRNQISGIVLTIIGVIVTIMVSQFKIGMTLAYPGPKLFPLIGSVGLILLGIGIFFQREEDAKKIEISKTMLIRIAIMTALTSVYVLGLKYLGFIISSPLYVFASTALFTKAAPDNKSKWWHWLIYSIAVVVIVYVAYVYAFSLRLPRGKLTGF